MIDAPALPPPALVAPAPREVSFGLVAGRAPAGTRRIIVRVGDRVVADRPLRGATFSLDVALPATLAPVRVTAVDGRTRRSSSSVDTFGLPLGSRPLSRPPTLDAALDRTIRSLVRRYGGTSAIYVQDLRTGRGAAWNARARFPAASTLKLAIAVTVLRVLAGKPQAGSRDDRLLSEMLIRSDNESANALLARLAGSTSAGSFRVDETMRALGLTDSLMYGGYEVERRPAAAGRQIPIRVERQPPFPAGKYTTAWDLARLARAVYLAAAGKGPLLGLGVTGSEARYLLFLLAQTHVRGRLDRYFEGRAVLLHKHGWLPDVDHDSGIVAFRGGAYVATVLTWRARGAAELTGRIGLAALERFS